MQLSYGALSAFLDHFSFRSNLPESKKMPHHLPTEPISPARRRKREMKRGESEILKTSAEQARPLIVCGMGRSGTRMCANILSNSRDVEMQGEIGGPAGSRMMAWLEANYPQRSEADPYRIYRLARATFREGSAGRPQDRPRALWFGYKSPRHERYFHRYERLFEDPARRPRYVYCLRNPFHVWRSYRAMPWNKFKDVRAFLQAWNRSVGTWETMRRQAPDRVSLFNLDSMIRSPDRLEWLTPVLLEPLNLSPEMFRRPVEALRNSNSAANKVGAEPQELPPADMAAIAADPDAAAAVRAYFPWLEEDLERLQTEHRAGRRLFGFLRG